MLLGNSREFVEIRTKCSQKHSSKYYRLSCFVYRLWSRTHQTWKCAAERWSCWAEETKRKSSFTYKAILFDWHVLIYAFNLHSTHFIYTFFLLLFFRFFLLLFSQYSLLFWKQRQVEQKWTTHAIKMKKRSKILKGKLFDFSHDFGMFPSLFFLCTRFAVCACVCLRSTSAIFDVIDVSSNSFASFVHSCNTITNDLVSPLPITNLFSSGRSTQRMLIELID